MSLTPQAFVEKVLGQALHNQPQQGWCQAFAPSNIALCKYWGKRDRHLNLPCTSSLSVSLGECGATTSVTVTEGSDSHWGNTEGSDGHKQPGSVTGTQDAINQTIDSPVKQQNDDCLNDKGPMTVTEDSQDVFWLNGERIDPSSSFAKRLSSFLDLFRDRHLTFEVSTWSNLPIGAGLASSAAGFAALVKALNQLFQWQLSDRHLSLLARLGSGSAARSLWSGFVLWHRGERDDGMDSYAEPLETVWPELRIGLLIEHSEAKAISSRDAMNRTTQTSPFYKEWPTIVERDLQTMQTAIENKDFALLGETAERNALAMHATMMTAQPPVLYWQTSTVATMHKIWQLREQGVPVYFTQDAGANLKLLYLESDKAMLNSYFPDLLAVDAGEMTW